VIVRPATPEDVPVLTALETTLFGDDAWGPSSVRDEIDGPGRLAVVAVEGDRVVGWAVTRTSHDLTDLQRIAVHPDHQRRGVARALLDEVLGRARADGASRVLLEVSALNAGALAFYADADFVEIDRRRRYYRDGSDAVVMRRALGRGACGGRG
jgi:ribosomal-protein-alanine acetyltransferase